MREYPIIVTDRDVSRLRGLLGRQSRASLRVQGHLRQLQSELEHALVLAADEVPVGVITIGSMVRVVDPDSDERSTLLLVLPRDADVGAGRISVLAPVGAALLGFRAGDEVEWSVPGGRRRLHVEHVMQPGPVAARRRVRAARQPRPGSPGVN